MFLVTEETPLLANNKYFIAALFVRLIDNPFSLMNGENTNVIFSGPTGSVTNLHYSE